MTSQHYRLYRVYASIIQRCENPNSKRYADYGGRGITLCPEWRNNFGAFETWALENGYFESEIGSHKCSLDRIDNDKGYSPENCRFVDSEAQSNNRRNNKNYTLNGMTKTIAQWAKYCGVPDYAMRDRLLKLHWSIKDAVTVPFRCQLGGD